MRVLNLCPGGWASNCYLLLCDGHAAVIDPSANAEQILASVQEAHARLEFVLLTHGHFDHILTLDALRRSVDVPVYIRKEDAELPGDANKNGFYPFFHLDRHFAAPSDPFDEDFSIRLGDSVIRALHTPGHTEGSVCYLWESTNDETVAPFLFTGDTIFANGFGRTDLYGGDENKLVTSLSSLFALPRDLMIYPGHGDIASLGDALDAIPFLPL